MGVELLGTTQKDHTCLAGTSWWFEGCISYLGTSVQPPLKTPDFEKLALCLIVLKLEGGLTPRHNYTKSLILGNFVLVLQSTLKLV